MSGFLSFVERRQLAAIASVLHGGQLFGAGPGDGEQECGLVYGFHVVTDGAREGEEVAGGEIVWLAVGW